MTKKGLTWCRRFFKVLKINVRNDGLLENELRIGHCSSHYHMFAFITLFDILQNLKMQGYDF